MGNSIAIHNYNINFVLKKLESLSFTISLISCLLVSFNLAATKERMENDLNASCTESVPSALSFLPVKGNTSGPRWHWVLILTRLTKFTNGSINDDTSFASLLKILTCIPCGESIWYFIGSSIFSKGIMGITGAKLLLSV
jgi:hypothetical protein